MMRNRNFTLIEVLMVVTVIAMIGSYGGMFFINMLRVQKQTALSAARQTNLLHGMKSFRQFVRKNPRLKMKGPMLTTGQEAFAFWKQKLVRFERGRVLERKKLAKDCTCEFSIEQEGAVALAVMTVKVKEGNYERTYVCREVIR